MQERNRLVYGSLLTVCLGGHDPVSPHVLVEIFAFLDGKAGTPTPELERHIEHVSHLFRGGTCGQEPVSIDLGHLQVSSFEDTDRH